MGGGDFGESCAVIPLLQVCRDGEGVLASHPKSREHVLRDIIREVCHVFSSVGEPSGLVLMSAGEV